MMDDRFLIDTSAWIYALRKTYIPEIKDRVDFLLKENLVLTTGIIMLELLTGARTEAEYERLGKRLSSLESIATGTSLWKTACDTGFRLKRKGVTIPYTDILIASCALSAECTVMHADRHFEIAAGHLGLKTESFVDVVKIADANR